MSAAKHLASDGESDVLFVAAGNQENAMCIGRQQGRSRRIPKMLGHPYSQQEEWEI